MGRYSAEYFLVTYRVEMPQLYALLTVLSLGVHSRLSSVDELRFLVFMMGSHTLQHDEGLIIGSHSLYYVYWVWGNALRSIFL
jgi:hypothetical protein